MSRDISEGNVSLGGEIVPVSRSRVRREILWAVEENLRRAERCFRRAFPRIPIEFDLTGGTSGQYWFPSGKSRSGSHGLLRFNMWIASRNLKEFIQNTVPHEVAHYLVTCIHGRRVKPHGTEWKQIMQECLGAAASRCHHHEVPYPYVFRCRCEGQAGEYRYTRRGFNNFLRGTVRYCPKCKSGLRFSHTLDINSGAVIHRNPVGKVFLYRQGRVNIKSSLRQLRAALNGYWPQELLVYNPKSPTGCPAPDMAWILSSSWTRQLTVPKDCTHAVAIFRRRLRPEVSQALESAGLSGIAVRRVDLAS